MAKWSEKQMAQGGSTAAQPMGLCGMANHQIRRQQDERHGDPADHVLAEREDEEDWLDADDWRSVNVRDGYYPLFAVLNDALNQAQAGKGHERHASADDQPFTDQPVLTISRAVGLGFPLGQAMKKIQECQRMDTDAAKRELLGAINYLAAAVLFLDE